MIFMKRVNHITMWLLIFWHMWKYCAYTYSILFILLFIQQINALRVYHSLLWHHNRSVSLMSLRRMGDGLLYSSEQTDRTAEVGSRRVRLFLFYLPVGGH